MSIQADQDDSARWWNDYFRFKVELAAGLDSDEFAFLHALQSVGMGDGARWFSRMPRAERKAYMEDMERRGKSRSGQMKKYSRLWETYISLRVAAKLSRG